MHFFFPEYLKIQEESPTWFVFLGGSLIDQSIQNNVSVPDKMGEKNNKNAIHMMLYIERIYGLSSLFHIIIFFLIYL